MVFKWLKPRQWGIVWQKETRMFYFALYWFVVRLDFGRKYRRRKIEEVQKGASHKLKELGKQKGEFTKKCRKCHMQCREFKATHNGAQ